MIGIGTFHTKAESLERKVKSQKGYVALNILNDVVFRRDKDYTNGLLLNYKSSGLDLIFRIGQDLYTPEDLSQKQPILGEHPYTAWYFMGIHTQKQIFNNAVLFRINA